MEKINGIMAELAKYNRMKEELEAIIDGLKDDLKKYMDAHELDTLTGTEHKATYKPVTSSRVDTTSLKKELPEIAARYTVSTTTKRFSFT